MLNCPLVLGDMADSPSGPWICSIVSSANSSDADSASAYFFSSDFLELIIRIVLWQHAMCSVSHARYCRQGGKEPIWWCSNTLKETRAFNPQHSFREDQRMLLAAHSSDSTNSLFKARAMAHRRWRQSRSISRRRARFIRRQFRWRELWISRSKTAQFVPLWRMRGPRSPRPFLSKKRDSGSLGRKLSLIHRANLGWCLCKEIVTTASSFALALDGSSTSLTRRSHTLI